MNRTEYSRCLRLIDNYWPHGAITWTPEVLEVWESLLLDLDANVVAAATQSLSVEGREFPPPPGLLRKRAVDLADPIPAVEVAWAEVLHKLTHGPNAHKEPTWSHPSVAAAVSGIGWQELCWSMMLDNERRRFEALYKAQTGERRALSALPPAGRTAIEQMRSERPALAVVADEGSVA